MKAKYIRITFLFLFLLAITVGCLKGCSGVALPKQKSLPKSERKKVSVENPFSKDSSITISAGEHYKKGKFHQWIFGSNYRDLWSSPVSMPLFDIRSVHGGMKIIKQGGNMQTLSLHLKAKDGKRYVLRTIDKDQSKTLPIFWRKTFVTYIMREGTSCLHPYSALVLPKLAEVAGILHTNPKLYFVPYDPNFKKFANLFEGRVAILEEFPDQSWIHERKFGYADSILSSEEMLAKRYSRQNVQFDQLAYARARLFDLWINDWDRHTGQWKWAEFNENNRTIYKPIPRDRDVAFIKFNTGIIPPIVAAFNTKFQSFNYDYNIKDIIKNAYYIDHAIFTNITEKDFTTIALDLQSKLTDSVIIDAIKTWPKEVFEKNGDNTIETLKIRRDKLNELAKGLYKEIFSNIKLVGTDQKEKFIIERINDQHTSVKIYNENDSILFENIYNNNITKELDLYGLNGEDTFIIKGNVNNGIGINLYGGKNKDYFKDESSVKESKKLTKIYDLKTDSNIDGNDDTDDQTSDDPEVIKFDRVGIRKKE